MVRSAGEQFISSGDRKRDSYIDSSAIAIVKEFSGISSPDGSQGNGEIIITTVQETTILAIAGLAAFLLLFPLHRVNKLRIRVEVACGHPG